MGLFDYVTVSDPRFVCTEGHALGEVEFQTKDLGCTMGTWRIHDGKISGEDGGYGDGCAAENFTGIVEFYGPCRECPSFVQAKTLNFVPRSLLFEIEIVRGSVVGFKNLSETLAEFLEREPSEPYMKGCFGPMSYDDGYNYRAKHR